MFKKSDKSVNVINKRSSAGGAYFVTYIGAAVYFVQHSNGFGGIILALLKSLVWPAFLIHRVFELIHI